MARNAVVRFAETVEALLGFMIVECENLDEAVDWAARHPDAEFGVVEVRPIAAWQEALAG